MCPPRSSGACSTATRSCSSRKGGRVPASVGRHPTAPCGGGLSGRSVVGEYADRPAPEAVGYVAAHVLLGGGGVAVEHGGHHGLVLGLDAGAVVGGVLTRLQGRTPIAVGLVPQA